MSPEGRLHLLLCAVIPVATLLMLAGLALFVAGLLRDDAWHWAGSFVLLASAIGLLVTSLSADQAQRDRLKRSSQRT